MFSLNLDYYSVEQVNNQVVTFTQDAWDSNSNKALNDVVDPNTEFKITTSVLTPVSTLESYGYPHPLKKTLGDNISTSSAPIELTKEKYSFTIMPTTVEGSAANAHKKEKNSPSTPQEIPQVHGAHKITPAGTGLNGSLFSAGNLFANGTSGSVAKTLTNSTQGISKRKKCTSNTNTSRGRQTCNDQKKPASGDESASPSQLARPFRNSQDRAEIDSNTSRCSSRFDIESNFSAETMSSLSGVSGHEEELFRIRRLLLLDSSNSFQEKLLEDYEQHSSNPKEDLHLTQNGHSHVKANRKLDWHATLSQAPPDKKADPDGAEQLPDERLRVELQQLRLDAESRDAAARGLKLKVAEQHGELQTLREALRQADRRAARALNDAAAAGASARWHRERLHAAQAGRQAADRALLAARADAVSARHAAARLRGDADALRARADEAQLRAVRDKDALVKKLEAIHAGMVEREAVLLQQLRREAAPAPVHGGRRGGEAEDALRRRDAELAAAAAANAALAGELAAERQAGDELRAARRRLDDEIAGLHASGEAAAARLRGRDEEVGRLAGEVAAAAAALATAAREKAEVDAAIELLRDDFAKIERHYQTMQDELCAKDKDGSLAARRCKECCPEDFADLQEEIVASFAEVEAELQRLQSNLGEGNVVQELLQDSNDMSHLQEGGCSDLESDAALRWEGVVAEEFPAADPGRRRTVATNSLRAAIARLRERLAEAAGFNDGRPQPTGSWHTGTPDSSTTTELPSTGLSRRLDAAAEALDAARVARGRSDAMCDVLRCNAARLQRELDAEQQQHEACKADAARQAEVDAAQGARLREEVAALRAQLAELSAATHSTLEQNKALRLRLEASCKPAWNPPPPLPQAPSRYDDAQIAELLRGSALDTPQNQPLASLQGCLDSLKAEMDALQLQLLEKSSARERALASSGGQGPVINTSINI